MKLYLWRTENKSQYTAGAILYNGEFIAHTLELPWRDNNRNISCIPVGEYNCQIQRSPRFGFTYIVQRVEDRSEILFHAGNTTKDTEGCILLGRDIRWKHGSSPRNRILLNSRDALLDFMDLLNGRRNVTLVVGEL